VEIEGIKPFVEVNFKFQSHKSADARLRDIKVNGSRVFLFECRSCGREFGLEDGESYWRAVRVGPFRVAWLPDEITDQWVAEPCPGKSIVESGSEKSAEVAPPIAPSKETAINPTKRRGRPPKVRSLPEIKQ
jgi:hypothetical protein